MAPDKLLEVRDLTKAFGGVLANDAISLAVPQGAIIGLIGPNGSGKTTLFNCIAGHHAADGGGVRFEGRDLAGLSVAAIARLGLVRTFQQAHVYDGLTCLQNMQISISHAREGYAAMVQKFPAAVTQKSLELLEFVALFGKRDEPAANLSYGQRKLLEFAMALMNSPKLLLLDEPTAGVNPALIEGVIARLRRANEAFGITLLVIEHNMRVMMELAHEIHCLAHGKLLASGSPAQIRVDGRVIDAYLGVR